MAESAEPVYSVGMKLAGILVLLGLLSASPVFADTSVQGAARVIDGDTIEINDQRIRLWGIDAPEISQRCKLDGGLYPCGLDASHELSKYIGHKSVSCTWRDTDRYGRMVALCRLNGDDLSRWMVQQGQAIAFRKYSLDYVADEDKAKAAKVGIWAGEFQDPSVYRHQSRRRAINPRVERHACACPDDTDRAGRRCGGRSAHARSHGVNAVCASR